MSADIHKTNRVGGVVSLIALGLCILLFILMELFLDNDISRFLAAG